MDINEWYGERNNRTNLMEGVALSSDDKSINVVVSDASDVDCQLASLITLNLLSRWCRRITISVGFDSKCTIQNYECDSFKGLLMTVMKNSDPFGEFTISAERVTSDFCLHIGKSASTADGEFWLVTSGWVYGFGFGRKLGCLISQGHGQPIGAAHGAASVNAVLFSIYLGIRTVDSFERWVSSFDHSFGDMPNGLLNPEIGDLDMGKVWQVGAGAVGSSFDYLLSFLVVKGSFEIIDYDHVTLPNISSSPVFSATDAAKEVKKCNVCSDLLSVNEELRITAHDMDYSEFIDKGHIDSNYPDCILCFANERAIWSTVQFNEPPLVYHATTSKNWGINMGRHLPFDEWCIVCRFGMKENVHVAVCGSGVIKVQEKEEKLGVLPFLPLGAAAFLLGSLIRQLINLPSTKNFTQFNYQYPERSHAHENVMGKKPDCPVCSTQDYTTYDQRAVNSIYLNGITFQYKTY